MPELKAAMQLSRTLNRPLSEICAMTYFEAQLWTAFLAPDEASPDTSAFEAMSD